MHAEFEDMWHVQFPAGDIRKVTLSELDASFNTGVINANTFVLQDGQTEWMTLREAAGLDDDEARESASWSSPPPAWIEAPSGRLAAQVKLDGEAIWRRTRSKVRTFLAAVMVIGSVGFVEHETGWRLEASESLRTRCSAALAAVREARTWQVTPAPVLEVRPAAPLSLDWGTCPENMTEGQRTAAVAAEKKRAAKKRARAVQTKHSTIGKALFTNGGHRFDPLNSKI
jgi:hypothetical protein